MKLKGCDTKLDIAVLLLQIKENSKIVELDLRQMPPFERHEKIFNIWDNLKSGYTLKIINDHDPKPLHYQFEAEQKGKYEWEYIRKGQRLGVQIKKNQIKSIYLQRKKKYVYDLKSLNIYGIKVVKRYIC